MKVIKRDGRAENVSFDKILKRIELLGAEIGATNIDYSALAISLINQLHNEITTTRLDELAAQYCAALAARHPNYAALAGRVAISNHHKNTIGLFSSKMNHLHRGATPGSGSFLSDSFVAFVNKHAAALDAIPQYQRDYLIDYFGFKTLEKGYLITLGSAPVERPQDMWLRVAVELHRPRDSVDSGSGSDSDADGDVAALARIRETYDLMSRKYFTHATPTLFNAGTTRPQLSSCFLLAMESDSLEGIFDTLKDAATISKYSGGVGMHIHNIRAKGQPIVGTNGTSNGLAPMLRVFNSTARFVDQGGGKRPGAIAAYLEPWHADVRDFLTLKRNVGSEDTKARDLFYAMWIPDLFMERVRDGGPWSLFCPTNGGDLADLYGDAFRARYLELEQSGLAKSSLPARDLWMDILESQMETGTPYMLYKDAVNQKSNQKNVGTIKSSNLCCEVMQYSDSAETAVCNLASLGLPMFVDEATRTFDYGELHAVTKVLARNLDRVIDATYYPTAKARRSNLRNRPIGIGVQGLADVFAMMDLAFDSDAAADVNRQIFETIYHAALEQSNEEAMRLQAIPHPRTAPVMPRPSTAGAYLTFEGSPASRGQLQFDLWGVTPSARYDWEDLRARIVTYGLRNSLLVAPMPTASTSQILGFNECFEPFTSNVYSRRTAVGEFTVLNKHLVRDLMEIGQWSESIKDSIVAHRGSIQHLTQLPEHVRDKFKIVWEIPMKRVIDMAADRGAFICQSQSMNLWMAEPTASKLTSMHFHAWKKGLKTGMYYLRRKARHQAQQFTIEPPAVAAETEHTVPEIADEADAEGEGGCAMCSA